MTCLLASGASTFLFIGEPLGTWCWWNRGELLGASRPRRRDELLCASSGGRGTRHGPSAGDSALQAKGDMSAVGGLGGAGGGGERPAV